MSGMEKEDPQKTVQNLVRGSMDKDDLAAFDSRLAQDPKLKAAAEEYLTEQSREFGLFDRAEPLPISNDMLSAYLDGELDAIDVEIVESSIEIDPLIAAQVQELRALREETTPDQPPIGVSMNARPKRLRDIVGGLFGSYRPWTFAGAGLAVACALVLILNADRRPDSPRGESLVGRGSAVRSGAPTIPRSTVKTEKGSRVAVNLVISPEVRKLIGFQPSSPSGNQTLGGGDGGELISPLATLVRSRRPKLVWSDFGVGEYVVRLTDETTGNAVPGRRDGDSFRWAPIPNLVPGHVYAWSVQGLEEDSPVKTLSQSRGLPAKFELIGDRDETKLDADLKDADGNSLSKAAVFAKYGLMDDSEKVLRQAVAQSRSRSDRNIAESLLARVRSRK